MAIAKEKGFELDSKELEEAVTELVGEEDELSEEDLENVAGGKVSPAAAVKGAGVVLGVVELVRPQWKSDVGKGAKAAAGAAEDVGKAVGRTAKKVFGGW